LHDHNNIKHFDILQKRSNHCWIQKHQFRILIVVKLMTNLVIGTCMWILTYNSWWFFNNFLFCYGLLMIFNKIKNSFQSNRTFLEFCVKHWRCNFLLFLNSRYRNISTHIIFHIESVQHPSFWFLVKRWTIINLVSFEVLFYFSKFISIINKIIYEI